MICLLSLTGLEGPVVVVSFGMPSFSPDSGTVPTVREILATREHAERDHIIARSLRVRVRSRLRGRHRCQLFFSESHRTIDASGGSRQL